MEQSALHLTGETTITTITRASAGSADPISPRTAPAVRFDSGVRLEDADHVRLTGQLKRVYDVMRDEQWRTVQALALDIERRFGITDPQPSLSAQLRNLRKDPFAYEIERRRVENFYQYRLIHAEGRL